MFIDCHTHAQFSAFKEDWKEVIDRSLANDVWVINVGTQKDTSQRAIEVADLYREGVYATIGLHPIHTHRSFHDAQEIDAADGKGFESRDEIFDRGLFLELSKNPKVVAIGECGLDYFHLEGDIDVFKQKQKEAFQAQIEFSKEVDKPLMIHSRDAYKDTLDILKATDPKPGIAHSFARTVDEARDLLEMGFYFTFAGYVTFPPKKGLPPIDDVIRFIPMDRILSETDAPYLAPVPYRGKRNEPVYVKEVVRKIAEIKGVSLEEMEKQIFENARQIFRI